jgi:nitrile hydratase
VTLAPGQRVRVLEGASVGHVRTPTYVKGKHGTVAGSRGSFRNPETLAFGGDGQPARPLYYVGFRQAELWPGYAGPESDTLYLDLYEHWLETA